MRKCKKILKTLAILIILTVAMGAFYIFSSTSEAAISDSDFATTITLNKLKNYGSKHWLSYDRKYGYEISGNNSLMADDAYCVQQDEATYDGGGMSSKYPMYQLRHTVKTVIKIKGNRAQWYSIKNEQNKFEATKINGKWCELDNNGNALMAAILCATKTPSGKPLELGCGDGPSYRESQVALYDYWDEWRGLLDTELRKKGFASDNLSGLKGQGKNASFVSPYISDYKTLASQNIYDVTIIYLEHTTYYGMEMLQRIIFVEREEPEPDPKNIDIPVEKVWIDGDFTKLRPSSIKVQLLANGKEVEGKILTLKEDNDWKGTFEKLSPTDSDGKTIQYTVKEVGVPEDYHVAISGNMTDGFKIKNRLKTKVTVIKKWEDDNDWAGIRPDSLTIKLYCNDNPVKQGGTEQKTVILNESNNWTSTFDYDIGNGGLGKFDWSGNAYVYTVKEDGVPEEYKVDYSDIETDEYGNTTITITNTYKAEYDGYIEIKGKVWEDLKDGKANTINGILDNDEKGLSGIKVTLKDANGKQFDAKSTAITASDGTYTIKVNYDNSFNVYKLYEDSAKVEEKLKTAYVEFEYDGLTYTTVKTAPTGENTSKAIEDEDKRVAMDNDEKYSPVDTDPKEDEKNNMTAKTQNVITLSSDYPHIITGEEDEVTIRNCDGTNYQETNPNGAWNEIKTTGHTHGDCPMSKKVKVPVTTIEHVNLGLMRREQPDLKIETELTTVEVNMNNQQYIYKYRGVEEAEASNENIKVQFQGDIGENNLYVYRRPVNPSNIAELNKEQGEMSVFVTYEVTVTNEADTLIAKVNSITNYFDKEYTLKNATINGNEITKNVSDSGDFNKAILSNLNIELAPKVTSSVIQLRYEVSQSAIKGLLSNDATLSNAVEIESYSTQYGEKTLYAEQRTGGRTGKTYGGYDKDSHPGNAGIQLKEVDFTYTYYGTTTTYEKQKVLIATVLEDDTDIAPSFLLCKDKTPKRLSGTVFEDADENTTDQERLGDGKYDSSKEKNVQNVKVELYEVKSDRTSQLAVLYDKDGNVIENGAVQNTSENGSYAFDGVVTGKEYYVKFIYGDDTSVLTNGATKISGVEPVVNARNYKSTIIGDETLKAIMQSNSPDFDKYWYMKIGDNNSVAVDNMLDRLDIEDLQYSNFNKKEDGSTYVKPENMTAYSKSFIIPVEFDVNKEAQVQNGLGNIEGISNELNKLDFGIIERPREDLFVEKTITYITITLGNGQKLIDGDPRTDKINYVKTMGFDDIKNGQQARTIGNKRLLAELDSELTQGAQLELAYEVSVTNNNEIDYDYGVAGNYSDITGNNYITTSEKAKYYYYGDKNGLAEMKVTLQLVDYMSSDIVYGENEDWANADLETLHEASAKLISDDVYKIVKEECIALQPKEGLITLARGEESAKLTMTARKILTSQEENVYDNHAEIIKIDGKTARTIQAINGTVKEKTYKPGNYAPGLGINEQDDNGVEAIITPPTGIINMIIYVIAGLVGLIVIAGGTIYIKKKVLIT